jgi:hypothetical protein
VERTADGGYVLLPDDGVSQPAMDRLTEDVDEHLEQATVAEIDILVIRPDALGRGCCTPGRAETADLLDSTHEEYAAAQRAGLERVACLAALPMQEPSVALEVLDRAIHELGLRRVSLVTHNDGRPLAGGGAIGVYARIAELGMSLFPEQRGARPPLIPSR